MESPVLDTGGTQCGQRRRWRKIITAVIVVLSLVVILGVINTRPTRIIVAGPVPAPPVVTNKLPVSEPVQDVVENKMQPEDFFGKWTGSWDDKWEVHFTISVDAQTGKLMVLYEWKESTGQPLRHSRLDARLEGNVLRIGQDIEMTLPEKQSSRALAVGKFATRRTAELIRQ